MAFSNLIGIHTERIKKNFPGGKPILPQRGCCLKPGQPTPKPASSDERKTIREKSHENFSRSPPCHAGDTWLFSRVRFVVVREELRRTQNVPPTRNASESRLCGATNIIYPPTYATSFFYFTILRGPPSKFTPSVQ